MFTPIEVGFIEINLTTFRKTIAIFEGPLHFGVSDASYLRLVNYLAFKLGAFPTVERVDNKLTYRWIITGGVA